MILVLLQPSMKRDAIIKYANAIKLSGMKGCFSTYLTLIRVYFVTEKRAAPLKLPKSSPNANDRLCQQQ